MLFFFNFFASKGSRNSILDIFQQPWPCRFYKYPFCYQFGEILTKLLLKYWKKVISKINIFCFITESRTQTLKITGEHSRVPMITQDCPWTLKTAHETSWAMLSMVQGHYEWYFAPWHHAHECLSALMRAVCAMVQWSWVLIVVYSGSWVLKSGHAPLVVLMRAIGAMVPHS